MATIYKSQSFDSAARTAGEAFTIQSGAVFKIDSDTRDGKNAAASSAGSMSSFNMTSATDGHDKDHHHKIQATVTEYLTWSKGAWEVEGESSTGKVDSIIATSPVTVSDEVVTP